MITTRPLNSFDSVKIKHAEVHITWSNEAVLLQEKVKTYTAVSMFCPVLIMYHIP